ncbi:hypothetical protein [Spiroplasma endosymbiont of Glossina fuscipes fuscipes]|uniref:hypothetical protein n=1 Tax=Spiroplasma endosymbiont of Glossina fuscipes fuscipes TaxID=2004463 RepID=UPI003C7637AB
MGIFKTASKLVFGEAPHKRMGMTRKQYDQYCAMRKEQSKAIEDEKTTQSILEYIEVVGYKSCCQIDGKEKVDAIWAMHPEVLSKDGTINPVLEQQNTVQDQNNSLKELELKKQILEMELKLQEMKTQQNK